MHYSSICRSLAVRNAGVLALIIVCVGPLAAASAEVEFGNSFRLYQLGRYEDSIDAARAAIKQRHDYAPAWNNIAAADLALGKWTEAAEAASESIRLQPGDNDLARNNLALAKLCLSNTPEGYVARSQFYFGKGRYDDTIQSAQAALNLRPDYPEAWNNLAAAYNCLSRWADAIHAAQRAVELSPHFDLAKNNLALAERELKKSVK
jgi:tetratricopeptide (TPR) repeat protein